MSDRNQSKPDLLSLVTPGEILLEELPQGLTANALAWKLGVPADSIQGIMDGECVITADMAVHLSHYFGNPAEFWTNLQQTFELDNATRSVVMHAALAVGKG